MPATWLVTSTPCEAISVPIEDSRSTHLSTRAGSAVTVTGGGFILRQEGVDHLRLEHELEIAEPAEKQRDDDAGNEEAPFHVRCPEEGMDLAGGLSSPRRAAPPPLREARTYGAYLGDRCRSFKSGATGLMAHEPRAPHSGRRHGLQWPRDDVPGEWPAPGAANSFKATPAPPFREASARCGAELAGNGSRCILGNSAWCGRTP